ILSLLLSLIDPSPRAQIGAPLGLTTTVVLGGRSNHRYPRFIRIGAPSAVLRHKRGRRHLDRRLRCRLLARPTMTEVTSSSARGEKMRMGPTRVRRFVLRQDEGRFRQSEFASNPLHARGRNAGCVSENAS